ncbi:unnamed protein product [Moneuplotes crassus]|uniref:Casein kinase I n=1 Tax=Euplotes crassus TaxID=5936 RepID=A0AAD2DAB0_EUPCR|nr:unnamed protein product [Moneuplotes crassus]
MNHRRYEILSPIGAGSFSKVYEVWDHIRHKKFAYKVEKISLDEARASVLHQEYEMLREIQILGDCAHIPEVYDYVEKIISNDDKEKEGDSKSDYTCAIVMKLMCASLARIKKRFLDKWLVPTVETINTHPDEDESIKVACMYKSRSYAARLLMQMLEAIEQVHRKGIVHRDVKASNFLIDSELKTVYLADFGLAKRHIDLNTGEFVHNRSRTEFRGTISFASLNAHNLKELGFCDDLWSWYYVLLEFFGEKLPWKKDSYEIEHVKELKELSHNKPDGSLWTSITNEFREIREIFEYIKSLTFADIPDYDYISFLLIKIVSYCEARIAMKDYKLVNSHEQEQQPKFRKYKSEVENPEDELEIIEEVPIPELLNAPFREHILNEFFYYEKSQDEILSYTALIPTIMTNKIIPIENAFYYNFWTNCSNMTKGCQAESEDLQLETLSQTEEIKISEENLKQESLKLKDISEENSSFQIECFSPTSSCQKDFGNKDTIDDESEEDFDMIKISTEKSETKGFLRIIKNCDYESYNSCSEDIVKEPSPICNLNFG